MKERIEWVSRGIVSEPNAQPGCMNNRSNIVHRHYLDFLNKTLQWGFFTLPPLSQPPHINF